MSENIYASRETLLAAIEPALLLDWKNESSGILRKGKAQLLFEHPYVYREIKAQNARDGVAGAEDELRRWDEEIARLVEVHPDESAAWMNHDDVADMLIEARERGLLSRDDFKALARHEIPS